MATSKPRPRTPGNPFDVLDTLEVGEDADIVLATEASAFSKVLDGKHPRSIAVVNYKGGVGKTTATFFLGAQIAHDQPKKKVLIVDIDAQCSLTMVFGQDPIAGNDQNILVLLILIVHIHVQFLLMAAVCEDMPRAAKVPGHVLMTTQQIRAAVTYASHREAASFL